MPMPLSRTENRQRLSLPLRLDADLGGCIAVLKFERIADQVLKQHAHQGRAGVQRREIAARHASALSRR